MFLFVKSLRLEDISLDDIATMAGLLGAVGSSRIILRGVGIFAVGVPLFRTYSDLSISEALSQVSSAPKAQLTTQGAQTLFGRPLITMIYALLGVFAYILSWTILHRFLGGLWFDIVSWVCALALYLVVFLPLFRGFQKRVLRYQERVGQGIAAKVFRIASAIVSAVSGACAGFGIGLALDWNPNRIIPGIIPGILTWNSILKALLIVYILLIIAAFLEAAAQPLPLHDVRLFTADATITGTLLAHSEGYWRIFELPGGRFTEIPDGQVRRAEHL